MTNTKGNYLQELRNGSRSQPIPSKKVRKQRTRRAKKAAAIKAGW